MTKAVIYCRVSSEEQKKNFSIATQKEELIKYCEDKNFELVGCYIDEGFSGTSMLRPELQRMLADIHNYDVIVVWKLDRLSRNTSDFQTIKDLIVEKNKALIASTEKAFNFNSASDVFMYDVNSAVAQYYSKLLSERAKAGQRKGNKEGYYMGGIPPFGYDLKDKVLYPNDEAQAVKRIFELSLNYGAPTVARMLEKEGVSTKKGNTLKPTQIISILSNEVYYGYLRNGKYKDFKINGKRVYIRNEKYDLFKGRHEPIITKELFDSVQEALKERKTFKGHSNAYKKSIYAGKIVCGECGRTMIKSSVTTKGRKYELYVCPSYSYNESHHNSIYMNKLNHIVFNYLSELLKFDTEDRKEFEINQIKKANKESNAQRAKIERKLNKLYKSKDKLIELYSAEAITLLEFKQKNDEYKKEIESLKKEYENIEILEVPKNNNLLDCLEKLNINYNTLDDEFKKKLVNFAINKIVVCKPKKGQKRIIEVFFNF